MSIVLNLPTKPVRSDVYGINPAEITINEANRGRHIHPTTEQVTQRAINMLDLGQIQPVEARRNPDKSLTLTLGYTRTEAARLIRKGFSHNGKKYRDPDFLLQVRITTCTDSEALKRNIAENTQRNQTSPIDDAFNHARLANELNMTGQEISDFYGYEPNNGANKVKQYRKLLTLDKATQTLIHEGKMGVQIALQLVEADPAEREALIKEATRENGTINGADIQSKIRQRKIEQNETDTQPRSLKEIRKFLSAQAENEDLGVKRFAKDLLDWVNGKKGDISFANAIQRLRDSESK